MFGAVVFRGAPYVPTQRRTITAALDLLDLPKNAVIADLGSGDGSFLKAAARRGLRAVGYEINPILCFIAWLRCFNLRPRVVVRLRDFWLTPLPKDTAAIFIFLAGPYMSRFKRKIEREMTGRSKPLLVISNGFAIPGSQPQKIAHGLYLYKFAPKGT